MRVALFCCGEVRLTEAGWSAKPGKNTRAPSTPRHAEP